MAFLPLFSMANEYTTLGSVVHFEVPPEIIGPAEVTVSNTVPVGDDRRIFVTAYARRGLFGTSLVGNLAVSLLEWPQDVTDFPGLLDKVGEYLLRSKFKVSRSSVDFPGGNWIVFEQRTGPENTLEAISCYTLLPRNEVLYVGLVMDNKMPSRQRSKLTKALQTLLGSFRISGR